MTRTIGRALLWLLLALPALGMTIALARGQALAMDLLHPSGEMSVRLMVLALLPGPLAEVFGPNRFLRGWLAIRRNLGVAAFGYAVLHLIFYMADVRQIGAMIDELPLPSIWTGWLALALMLVPAAISFDRAMRALKRRWQHLQYFVYPALLIALAHWLLLGWNWQAPLIHLAPLAIAWALRAHARSRRRTTRKTVR